MGRILALCDIREIYNEIILFIGNMFKQTVISNDSSEIMKYKNINDYSILILITFINTTKILRGNDIIGKYTI